MLFVMVVVAEIRSGLVNTQYSTSKMLSLFDGVRSLDEARRLLSPIVHQKTVAARAASIYTNSINALRDALIASRRWIRVLWKCAAATLWQGNFRNRRCIPRSD
jgi:hypothetical protein